MNKQSNGIISSISWSFAERLVAQGIGLVVSIVLARLLEPNQYGIIAIVLVFISIGDALVTGGFGNALIQKKDSNLTDFNTICWFSVVVASVLYLILFICAPLISDFYNMAELTSITRVMGIKLVFSAINSIQIAYVQKNMVFKKYFWISLIGATISAIVGISMAFEGFGVWALVWQNLSLTVVNTGLLFFFIDWKMKFEWNNNSINSMWSYGSKIYLSTITYTIKDNIRSLIVGKVFSSEDLAFYNQGQKYPSLLVTNIVESQGKVLFPVFSNNQESTKDIKELSRMSIVLSSYLLLPCVFGLIGIGDTFVTLLLTEKWLPCVKYMQILSLVYITRSMSTIFQKALLSIGKSNINLAHEIITSVLTVVFLLLSVFIWNSIDLIAWSYVIIAIAGTMFFCYFMNKHFDYKVSEVLSDYLPPLILSLIMGLIVLLLGKINIPTLYRFCIQILGAVVVYVSGSLLLKLKGMKYLQVAIQKILKKK